MSPPRPFSFLQRQHLCDVGRALVDLIFAELPTGRRREVMSAVAHYIAGVLLRETMVEIVQALFESADFATGDRVKTLRGSTWGVVVSLLEDGRVVWRPDGAESELMALPESLLRQTPREKGTS